ncbi:MAG: TRAP transporter small permease [Comamonadaceae bacterium]|nr:MAG: TRAP transporter small permease [Comamonadaceae bacterium]
MKLQRLLVPAAEGLGRALATVAGLALLAMMVLTFVDVMGRKFWVAVPGALELSEMLMVVVLFSGLPLVAWHAEHVVFELVDKVYTGRAAIWSRVFMDVFCGIVFGALGVALWGFAGRTMDDAEVTVYLRWPVGWFVYLIAVLVGISALMHLLRAATLDLHPEEEASRPAGPTT